MSLIPIYSKEQVLAYIAAVELLEPELYQSPKKEKILNDLKKYKQNKADKKLDYSFILVGHNEKGNHMQCLVSFYWPDFFYHIEGCRLDEEEGEVLDADEVVYDDRILEIIDEFINF